MLVRWNRFPFLLLFRSNYSLLLRLSFSPVRIYLRPNTRRSFFHFDVPCRSIISRARGLCARIKILTYFNDSNGLSYIRVWLAYVEPVHAYLHIVAFHSVSYCPLCMYILSKNSALLAPLDKRQDTRRWLLAFFRKCRRLLPRTCCTRKSWCSQTWLKLDWKRVPIIDRRTSCGDISYNYMYLNLPGNVELSCISWSDDVFLNNQSNLIIILFIFD